MSDPVVTPAPSLELRPPTAPLTPPPQVADEAEEHVSVASVSSLSSPPELPAASPCTSTNDSSNSSNTSNGTSSTTETALKAVSEGELLSQVQLEDTMTGSTSSSSSSSSSGGRSLTPLSPLCRGGSLHLLLNAGHGEHLCVCVCERTVTCCGTSCMTTSCVCCISLTPPVRDKLEVRTSC